MSIHTADQAQIVSYDAEGNRTTSVEQIISASEDSIAFWMPNDAGADVRFQENSVVSVRECGSNGKPLPTAPVLEGRSRIAPEGSPEFNALKQIIGEHHNIGWQSFKDKVSEVFGQKTPECVVIIEIIG